MWIVPSIGFIEHIVKLNIYYQEHRCYDWYLMNNNSLSYVYLKLDMCWGLFHL